MPGAASGMPLSLSASTTNLLLLPHILLQQHQLVQKIMELNLPQAVSLSGSKDALEQKTVAQSTFFLKGEQLSTIMMMILSIVEDKLPFKFRGAGLDKIP